MNKFCKEREEERKNAIEYVRSSIVREFNIEGEDICMSLYTCDYSFEQLENALEYLGINKYKRCRDLDIWFEGIVNKRILGITKNVGRIINYTPHDINIVSQDGELIKTYSSKGIARVSAKSLYKDTINEVDIFKTEYGKVEGLPSEEKEGTYYIVSMLVKQACPNRKDLLSPSQLVRDSEGKIIGCLGLE
ncbi:hypothetical protein [Clostridium botulinum]|uniref:hypothetical protein n=1 Tax=Clostridium botulinum TaxID=1491 RepID=UPI001A928D30|nr:hypothetical protein [Clostridium botulinum]MBO0526673.1 hypothetical protein [Clostridium botulinum]MBO0526983.1 hypothetical protein [Clostridium botulinum]MBO0532504.1 hypothetical protein [Clostridium botulinum]MBO0534387.1 hypothetical protein [Clostridium botulinum]MBO0538905.1 hypothetical protein [Clostridium botulinum]